jgi:hypothetical protein
MSGLYLLLPTFLVIILSLFVVQAGAIALNITGMEKTRARFQALSAFTRTGFTTREAELVTKNRRRRTIITWLMILGNAGIVTVIVTATFSLATSTSGTSIGIGIGILLVGIVLVYLIAKFTPVSRIWSRFIESRFIDSEFFEEVMSEDLLHLNQGFGLLKIFVKMSHLLSDIPCWSLIHQRMNSGWWVLKGTRSGFHCRNHGRKFKKMIDSLSMEILTNLR